MDFLSLHITFNLWDLSLEQLYASLSPISILLTFKNNPSPKKTQFVSPIRLLVPPPWTCCCIWFVCKIFLTPDVLETNKKKDLTRQRKRHIHWYLHRVLYFIASLGEQILIHARQIVPLYFYDDTVANLSSYSQNARLETKKTAGQGGAPCSGELKQMGVN